MENKKIGFFDRVMELFSIGTPWYLKGQPEPVKHFLKSYAPLTLKERVLFNRLMDSLKTPEASHDEQHQILAQIGDRKVLQYLFEAHPDNSTGIRELVVENPNCPTGLLRDCLQDRDYHVRLGAIKNISLSNDVCLARVFQESNPFVQDALKERLGEMYPFQSVGAPTNLQDAMNAFIGRAFEQNKDPNKEYIAIYPILTAYTNLKHEYNSPERALYQLSNTLVGDADADLLNALYAEYSTDKSMVERIMQNPNCPFELYEKGYNSIYRSVFENSKTIGDLNHQKGEETHWWRHCAERELPNAAYYIENFTEKQLCELVIANRTGHDISVFADPQQTPEQLRYIYMSAEAGEDIS